MKTLLFISSFFFFSITTYSQNIVGNVKRGPYLIAELSFKSVDTTNTYKIRYLDASSQILKSIEFVTNINQLDELYTFISKMLSEKNGSNKEMQIGVIKISATTQKMVGFKNVLITINESSNFGMNEKEINKLFGK